MSNVMQELFDAKARIETLERVLKIIAKLNPPNPARLAQAALDANKYQQHGFYAGRPLECPCGFVASDTSNMEKHLEKMWGGNVVIKGWE